MIPGSVTRLTEKTVASTTSIEQDADLLRITGSTEIATITPSPGFLGFSGICIIFPTDGTLGLLTTGNIAVAVTAAQNRATVLVWSRTAQKWLPGAIS